MDDEELTELLKDMVFATAAISENVEVIAGVLTEVLASVLTRAEDKLEEE